MGPKVLRHRLSVQVCICHVCNAHIGLHPLGIPVNRTITKLKVTNNNPPPPPPPPDNFKFDENGRKLFKRVENTVGKGEIARYEQFFLFPQCLQKACFPGASKGVIVCEWVKEYQPGVTCAISSNGNK